MGRKDIKQKMNQTQTAMQIFEYQGNEVRTIQHGDEVWWVLRDVCRVLSLSNPAKVAQRLDEDEKDITLSYTPWWIPRNNHRQRTRSIFCYPTFG